jgi:YidC/Oxa1 family membrane protein insertase
MVVGFALIVAILVGWQVLFKPKPRQQPVPPPVPTQNQPPETTAVRQKEPEPRPTLTPVPPRTELMPESTVTLENRLMRLEFSNVGGTLKSIRLKGHRAELVPEGKSLFGTTLLVSQGEMNLAATPMHVTASDTSVTFSFKADSLSLAKTYVLNGDYTLEHQLVVRGPCRGFTLDVMAGIARTEPNSKEALAHFHFYARADKKLHQVFSQKLKRPLGIASPSDWAGVKSKYFLLAVIGRDHKLDSTYAAALDDGRVGFTAVVRQPAPDTRFLLYLGPIEYGRLRSFGVGLENVAGLGITKPVALAMLWVLRLLYRIFANWGVAIVVFSVLMKAVFYPLTRTQTRQMRQMQLIQPKLNELKAKYKDDAQRLNQETMQLYRLYKINPMSGCLPLVVQLPIFWALYAVLRSSIELREAALGLWLKDLSQPDVLFGHMPAGVPMLGGSAIGLLPILMGVSFIAQNLLTSTDKRNWALTVIFPVFITAIFLNMPSGLQLYWFIYNVLSIGESIIGLKGGGLWRRTRSRKEPSLPAARPPK